MLLFRVETCQDIIPNTTKREFAGSRFTRAPTKRYNVVTSRYVIQSVCEERGLSDNGSVSEPDASNHWYPICIVGKMRVNTKGENKK